MVPKRPSLSDKQDLQKHQSHSNLEELQVVVAILVALNLHRLVAQMLPLLVHQVPLLLAQLHLHQNLHQQLPAFSNSDNHQVLILTPHSKVQQAILVQEYFPLEVVAHQERGLCPAGSKRGCRSLCNLEAEQPLRAPSMDQHLQHLGLRDHQAGK